MFCSPGREHNVQPNSSGGISLVLLNGKPVPFELRKKTLDNYIKCLSGHHWFKVKKNTIEEKMFQSICTHTQKWKRNSDWDIGVDKVNVNR